MFTYDDSRCAESISFTSRARPNVSNKNPHRTTEALAANERHCWCAEAMRVRNGVAESRAIVAQQRVGLRIRPPRSWNDHCSCSHRQNIVGETLVHRLVWVQTPFSLRFAFTTDNFFTFLDVRRCSVSYWLGKIRALPFNPGGRRRRRDVGYCRRDMERWQ